MQVLKNPDCKVCGKSYQNFETVKIYMINAHSETPHERLVRLEESIKSATDQETANRNVKEK